MKFPYFFFFSLLVYFTSSAYSLIVKYPSNVETTTPSNALVIVFAIPTLVNATMGLLGENFSISSCWNNAEQIYKPGNSKYNDGNDGVKSGAININPEDYE